MNRFVPEHKRILVIKLGALGDFIQALGPMAAIRRHHPKAHITLLTTKGFADFGKECGYFDEIMLDEKPGLLNMAGWRELRRRLIAGDFSRVYDLQNNDRTALYLWLLKVGGHNPEWVGAARGASHRNASPARTAGHAFDGHAQTLALAGIHDVRIDRLEWMEADLTGFALRAPWVLLVPGCAPQHPHKRWPAEKYGRLAKILFSTGYHPVIIGGKPEEAAAAHIVQECPEALDLTGKTSLKQIVVMAGDAAGAVGNDTGPMHLIAATGCPSLVLFSGRSNPARHAPKGERVEVIQENDLTELTVENVVQHFKPSDAGLKKSSTMH
ncbi:MAG: glycosyltransferase family 9 protein [Alphaproteobacteria bacterium]|nr:glycosyltransferase family 9 protein [Alphaproteobacteria bacterium]